MTPLGAEIRSRIAAEGPIGVDAYMALALGHREHGYYRTRDPLGAAGDFVTAPEISQMFGELVGLWLAQVWIDQGRPAPVTLAELGPGRGTLMADALRALGAVPELRAVAQVALVETSPVLRAAQAARLVAFAPVWVEEAGALPRGPLLVVANEFFDALPVRQHRRADPGWQERRVALGSAGLAFVWGPPRVEPELDARFPLTPDGVIVETSPAAEAVARVIGARIAAEGGAALIVDYGAWDGAGDTLQAVRAHRAVDPLAEPGQADLTAHVRFRTLAEAARPARAWGLVAQGALLARLGIGARAERLARGADAATAAAIEAQLCRLTDAGEMGTLFQALALTPSDAPPPPGFDADDA